MHRHDKGRIGPSLSSVHPTIDHSLSRPEAVSSLKLLRNIEDTAKLITLNYINLQLHNNNYIFLDLKDLTGPAAVFGTFRKFSGLGPSV